MSYYQNLCKSGSRGTIGVGDALSSKFGNYVFMEHSGSKSVSDYHLKRQSVGTS